ncbi:SET domain-containing protein [Peniophora sp. CONT]|nr:SET domain-containing protein [Peniophora sp. CONT]
MSASSQETSSIHADTIADTVVRTQEEVRREFDAWNRKHVKEVVRRDIRRPIPEPSSSRNASIESILGMREVASSDDEESGDCISPLAPGVPVAVKYDISDWEFEPTPEYEYCAPIDGNRYVGDDSSALIFDPLSGTPGTKHKEFLDLHDDLAWTTLADPADEFIALETAARLQERHGLSPQEIHESEALSPPLFDWKNICGVFGHGNNRDFPDWPGPSPTRIFNRPENQLASASVPRCPHRGCVSSFPCTLHDPKTSKKIIAHSAQPILELEILRKENAPCGPDCGLLKGVDWTILEPWPDSEKDDLREALTQQPSMLPCHYAAVLNVRCAEVFGLCMDMLPELDSGLTEERQKQRAASRRRGKKKKPVTEIRRAPYGPCAHDGPCTSNACPCYKVSGFCERDCRCSNQCDRRWKGCSCSTSLAGVTCTRRTCKCLAASRECDPDVCGKCGAGDVEEHTCGNVSLQRRKWKRMEIRQSSWGYGAFLLEPAMGGELVIEYVGEIIAQPTVESREFVAIERGRHYLYDVNEVFTLDASYASNTARYINHDSKKVNCQARVRLVGGEHRIALIAERNISVGEELFLDYGKEFPIPGEHPE